MKEFFDHLPPALAAFLEAVAALTYIVAFATLAQYVTSSFFPPTPLVGMVSVLTAFMVSALITGTLVLGYPTLLIFEGARGRAIRVIAWCVVWFALFLVLWGSYFWYF